MRVLAVKRISRDSEASSALERQDVALARAIREQGHTLAGWVEDATVSGAVNLDKRRSLGKWLKEPLIHEWDAMMVTEQDRITRDDLHWAAFVGWLLEKDKTAIILDDPTFDISTPNGRMIATIKATQAANYRIAIQKKSINQREYYRDEGLFAGGTWPFGYRAEPFKHNGDTRYKLAVDPVTGPLVREAYERLVNMADHISTIVRDWNRRGILTAQDYQRSIAGKPLKNSRWTTTALKHVLTKEAILGYAMHRGEVRKKNGLPVQWAPNILTRAEFDRLQEAIAVKVAGYGRTGKRDVSDLVGVAFCLCGEPLYSNIHHRKTKNGGKVIHHYFRCRTISQGKPCGYARNWNRDKLYALLEESFIGKVGHLEILSRVYVPGSDRSSEIGELREALDNLAGNLVNMKPGSAGAQVVIKAIEEHESALAELEAVPVIPSRWQEESTGQTFRQWWGKHQDWSERCDFLKKMNVKLHMSGTTRAPIAELSLPDDLQTRIS